MRRDRCSEELARSKITAQMPLREKEKRAHYVIDNSGTPSATHKQACPCDPYVDECLLSNVSILMSFAPQIMLMLLLSKL